MQLIDRNSFLQFSAVCNEGSKMEATRMCDIVLGFTVSLRGHRVATALGPQAIALGPQATALGPEAIALKLQTSDCKRCD
jgi:hypothetical protein